MTAAPAAATTWQQLWTDATAALRDAAHPAARPGVAGLREEAFARFRALGFPTTRDEAWRFTSVAPIAQAHFDLPEAGAHSADAAWRALAPDLGGAQAVMLDGRVVPALGRGADGARIESLASALAEDAAALEPHLARIASDAAHPFLALNTAFLSDGVVVRVPRGVRVETPIHVGSVVASSRAAIHPRVLIVLEEGAQASVVETHGGDGDASLSNAVSEIVLGEGAVLDHSHVQIHGRTAFHVASTAARVGRSATLRSHVVSLGARLSRHDLHVHLAGEGASCSLDGLSFLGGSQHADHRLFVDHAVPHASSDQLYKGIFAGRSKGVFTGKVLVRGGAKGTVAHQKNRNLLLSTDALVDTQPQLEIHDDDVRCTHGATIGQLDEDQVFYLRARALSEAEAKRVLTRAFASEVVARIPSAVLREDLERRLAGLGGEWGDAA